MIIFRPIFWFVILFLNKISGGYANNEINTEQRQLERNLKILRNDFNKLIETVEDFAGDLLMQIRDAGKLMGNTYITDNDYNWQDDNLNTIEKTTKHTLSSLPIITEIPNTILGKTLKFPKLHFPKISDLLTKNIEQQEVSNDIEKREKRSTHMAQKFENINIPPSPIMGQEGPVLPPRMPENLVQRSAAPVMSEFSPFPDRTINIRGEKNEQDNFSDDNAGQRSAAQIVPEIPPFTDRTTNVRGDKKQENFLEARESAPEQTENSGSTTFLPNQKSKDSLICAARTQKEMDLEKQKMDELRGEVKKLNELVALLKDQQRVIKMFNDIDKHLENNEVTDEKGNFDDSIKDSFLYRTLKKLQNIRSNGGVTTPQNYGKDGTSNISAKDIKSGQSDIHNQNPRPTFEDLEKIKIDLRTTAENLNKTKEVIIKEKKKEDDLEQELKRQKSELKFLKVMTENLYDKMGERNENSKKDNKVYEHDKTLRNSDFEDIDVDSLLESVHTPRTMPAIRQQYNGESALPKIYSSSNSRESNPGDNQGTNMHEFLSILNQNSKSGRNENNKIRNVEEINQNDEARPQENSKNIPNKENNTYLSMNARESSSGKVDDIDLKLKILEALSKHGRSDDISSKEKELSDAMKKLLAPEKKSEDNQLDALMALFKEKSEPKTEKGLSEETLKKLFKELNTKPQSKTDDVNVESELRQLQKAINSLRPKEDSLLDNLDLGNNRGKQDGDIQSMLNQIITQNGAAGTASASVDLAGTGSNLDLATATGDGSVSSGSLNLPGVFASSGGGKYTPQQMLQLNKIMGTLGSNSYNGGAGSAYSGLGANSNPAVQKLLSQYIASSSVANKAPYGHGGYPYAAGPQNYGSGIYSSGPNLNLYAPNLDDSSINSYGIGSSSYQPSSNAYNLHSNYGLGSGSYSPSSKGYPHSNLYGGTLSPYGSNINLYQPNSNAYGNSNSYSYNTHPHGSNPYNSGPYSNPYSSSAKYGPNPGSYGGSYGFNNLGYDGSPSYEAGTEEYGASPIFLSQNYGNNYNSPYHSSSLNSYSGDAALPHYTIPALPSYDVNTPHYAVSKNEYQSPSYENIASGGYPSGNQGPSDYHNSPSYDKNGYSGSAGIGFKAYSSGGYAGGNQGPADYHNGYSGLGGGGFQNYGSEGYPTSGTGYQGLSNDYSGVTQGNKAGYGSVAEHNDAGAYQNYGARFFHSEGPTGNIGAPYHGNSYGSKGYGGPSVDQPYGNGQNGDQYKYSMATDLAKQIESLENAITGLNRHDYTQTPEDKATVASLEQRIYELKGVISSLNKPSYGTQQSSYQNKQPSYGSHSPEPSYSPNQGSYKQPQQPYAASQGSYGGGSQSGPSSNAYGSLSQTSYQPNALSEQTASNVPNHNSYNHYYGSAPASQSSYGAGSHPQTSYASTSPPQAPTSQPYQENQPSYTPNEPNSPNHSPNQLNHYTNSPLPYPSNPPANTHSPVAYQPSPPQNSPPYQPKVASGEDRSMTHGVRKELHRVRSVGGEKNRRKRQVNGPSMSSQTSLQIPPEIPQQIRPVMSPQIPIQAADTDMTINMRQNYGGEGNKPVGYNFGGDALTQIANTFKQYLEENLTNENENDPKQYQTVNNQESRNSAVATLQERLDFLKKQLESQRPSGRSLNDFFGTTGITNHIPPAPAPLYGSNNYYLNNQFKAPSITSLEKTFNDKKQDIFTEIVLKILEKILGSLPSVLPRLFGNLASTIGDSYGDNYSPLQTIFKNLGAVGHVPLIVIKLLETVGIIIRHLGKNKFFKNFLLPAGGVALAGLFILFLVYFYQQDERYGYIGYQGNYKYPQYQSNSYGHNNYGATDYGSNYGNYGNYKSDSDYYSSNRRSDNKRPLPNYNRGFYGDDIEPSLPSYDGDTRGHPLSNYDDNFYDSNTEQVPYRSSPKPYNNPDFNGKNIDNFNYGEGKAPLHYSRGYYDYFDDRFMRSRNKNVNR